MRRRKKRSEYEWFSSSIMISDALFINHLLPILIFKIYYFSQINRMWMCKYEWMVEWIIPVLTYAILYLHLPFEYTHFLTHNVYEWMGNIPSVHPFCWICAGDVLELFELRNVIINLIIAALHTLNCNYFQCCDCELSSWSSFQVIPS